MKKLVLSFILLFSISSKATQVQIDFVNGFSINISNPVPLSPSEGSATTDISINAIFSNHNVNHCVIYYTNQYAIIIADYYGTNLNAFRNNLLNNVNVSKVKTCYPNPSYYTFADQLYVTLLDGTNGNPIGTTNGIITTSNASLNAIFTNYNVTSMVQTIPSNILYYDLFFDGDIVALRTALNNLNTVIQSTDLVGVPMLLNTSEFDTTKIVISPNPFTNNFSIQTEETISNYTLLDISGKQIINTYSKKELENLSLQLNSGLYFLNLQYENGRIGNFKLIKQ